MSWDRYQIDPLRLRQGAGTSLFLREDGTWAALSMGAITGTKAQFNTAVTDGDIVFLDSTDTITGVKTMSGLNVILVSSSGLTVRNPANTFKYTLTAAAIAADRILNLPLTTTTDTLACLGLAQTFTGIITTSSGTIINSGTSTATTKGQVTANTASAIPAFLMTGYSTDTSSDTTGGGVIYMTHNASGNRQICFGASENFNIGTAAVFRFMCGAGIATLDAATGDGAWRLPVNLGTDTGSVAVGNNSLAFNATLPGKLSVYPEAGGVGVNINLAASGTGDLQRWCSNAGAAQSKVTSTGSIISIIATAHIGYGTGAGGTVTQATNKSTGVTLSKPCGAITMNNAALAAGTIVSFTLTNTTIAATDVLVLNHISGGTPGSYTLNARCAAGSATIDVRNNTAGSLSEAIVLQFALVKGVNA